jgi:hypothetical protein
MAKRLFTPIALASLLVVLLGGTAFADTYPIAPPGATVSLNASDFIQFVPQETPGMPVPNPVSGNNIGQHPGAFGTGFPPVGWFFIGVFGDLINTNDPTSAIYLWETSAAPFTGSSTGPQIQLGYWNGNTFSPFGIPQSASYFGTGAPGMDPFFEITSSITPLIDFGITPGFGSPLNALLVKVVDPNAHNQVTAVAANTVPEPSSLLLLGTCIAGLLVRWQRLSARL